MSTTIGRASFVRLVMMLATLSSLYQLTMGGRGFAPSDIHAAPGTPVPQAATPGDEADAICRTCDPPDPPPSPRPSPTPTPRPSFTTLMGRYTPYDINGDGRQEINSL